MRRNRLLLVSAFVTDRVAVAQWGLTRVAAGLLLATAVFEVARQAGRPVRYVNLPQAEYVAALEQAGLPDFIARMLGDSSFQTSKDVLYDTSGDLSRLIGRPTEPIAAVIARALGQT